MDAPLDPNKPEPPVVKVTPQQIEDKYKECCFRVWAAAQSGSEDRFNMGRLSILSDLFGYPTSYIAYMRVGLEEYRHRLKLGKTEGD